MKLFFLKRIPEAVRDELSRSVCGNPDSGIKITTEWVYSLPRVENETD